jgi:HPr kinase/phosphorylase
MSVHLHGTAVAIGGLAVLLTGNSGSGKSDLALRLIDRGAILVGDDQVQVDDPLTVSPHPALAGKLEVRGIGILSKPFIEAVPLRLIIQLGDDGERLPSSWPLTDLLGWSVPSLRLSAFAASAPIKVEHALQRVIDEGLLPVRLSELS